MRRHRRIKLKYKNPYISEKELCDVFIKCAKENGWKVYPETSGFDILIVKDIQIGIQAKLKSNVEVLAQVIYGQQQPSNIHYKYKNPSPHIRAVLVPHASSEFKQVANALNIFVIEGAILTCDIETMTPYYAKNIINIDGYNKKHLIIPDKLCWVPEIEFDTPAGVKSPKSITEWKIKAVKICLLLHERGFITQQDFKDAKLSITLWHKKKWLINSGEKLGKLIKYIRNNNVELPDQKYPEIASALLNKK